MKRPALIAFNLALVVAAYPTTAWFIGKKVEANQDAQYNLLKVNLPHLNILKRDYQRGVFHSKETVTFAMIDDQAKASELTVHSDISHGPFPDGGTWAMALVESKLVLDDATKQTLGKLFGDKEPMQSRMLFRFDGTGNLTLTSPASSATLPVGTDGKSVRITWEGAKLNMDFSGNLSQFTWQAQAPKFEARVEDGAHVVMTGLVGNGEQRRIFEDEPLLYSGTQRFTIDQMSFGEKEAAGNEVLLRKLTISYDMPVNGEFIDLTVSAGVDEVQVEKQNYGPARYEQSFRHVHGRTMAKLYRLATNLNSNAASNANQAADPDAMFAPMINPLLELLHNNPEVRVNLGLHGPKGETSFAAQATLRDVKEDDFSTPVQLIDKVDASVDLALPKEFLTEIAGKADSQEEAAIQKEMLAKQLLAFTEQGYISQEGALIKTKIVFKDGQLMANGKSFNPMAMLLKELETKMGETETELELDQKDATNLRPDGL